MPPGENVGFHVPDGPVAGAGPAHEQERGSEPAALVRLFFDGDAHGIRLPVLAGERRGAVVLRHVAAERDLAHARRWTASRTTLPRMKAMFAGRSASRRIR